MRGLRIVSLFTALLSILPQLVLAVIYTGVGLFSAKLFQGTCVSRAISLGFVVYGAALALSSSLRAVALATTTSRELLIAYLGLAGIVSVLGSLALAVLFTWGAIVASRECRRRHEE